MSGGQLARVPQAGYTESEAAESVADISLDLLTNFQEAGTLLEFAASSERAHR